MNRNDLNILVEKMFILLKTNISLLVIYPLIIFVNFKVIKIFSDLGFLKLYLIIILISQFEIGYIKEVFVKKNRLYLKDLILLVLCIVTVISILIFFLVNYFKIPFSVNFILVLMIGMILNEIKAFFDSRKHYDFGFLIKSILLIFTPFIFLLKNSFIVFSILFIVLIILLILLRFIILKFSDYMPVLLKNNLSFFRFFIINFLSFFGGNIDRFLIFPNANKTFFDQYVVLTESNSKVNSAFGFFNNLFLFGHLKLTKYLVIIIFILLNFCFLFIQYYFDLDYKYFIFSFSTLFSILGQYFIFSSLKDIKHSSSSFFPAIGISVFLISFLIVKFFLSITIISITLLLVLKTVSELAYLYTVKRKK